jgi:hypothetical protein
LIATEFIDCVRTWKGILCFRQYAVFFELHNFFRITVAKIQQNQQFYNDQVNGFNSPTTYILALLFALVSILYNPLSVVIIRIWQIDTFQMSGGRTPLGGVTNTMRDSQTMPQLIDAKECKRAKERL